MSDNDLRPSVPFDINNERAVLSSCLLDRDAITVIRPLLGVEDFYLEKHGLIYSAMLDLTEKRIPPDLTTVAGRLKELDQYDLVGGMSFLGELLSEMPTAVHVEHYARRVNQTSAQRRIIQLTGEMQARAYTGGDIDGLFKELQQRIDWARDASTPRASWEDAVTPGRILFRQKFEVLPPTVEHILPAGTMLLTGKPKTRKSWLALNIALAVASGGRALGHFQALAGDVLYIDLEMGLARLHKRLHVVIPQGEPPKGLNFATTWPPVGEGFDPWLRDYLKSHPFTRLVVVDTMVGVRPQRKRYEDPYEADKRFTQALTNLCQEYAITILLIHHSRKADGSDITDEALGTNGLTGGVDNFATLKLKPGGGELNVRGRDIEIDGELPLTWDTQLAQWNYTPGKKTATITPERQKVLDLLAERDGLTYKQIAAVLARPEGSTSRLLGDMKDAGLIEKVAGAWFVVEAE